MAQRIRAARKLRRWSQEHLAHEVGVTVRTIGRWEHGDDEPGGARWNRLMEVLPELKPRNADLTAKVRCLEERLRRLEAHLDGKPPDQD